MTSVATNSGIQVISRAVEVLRAVRDNPIGLSLSEIAKITNLPRSTVQRIVHTLVVEGMLMPAKQRSGWLLGPEGTSMGNTTHLTLINTCKPLIIDIFNKTGESVDLSIFNHVNMIFIDQITGNHRLRTSVKVGDIFPLTTTANGCAVLALLPDEQVIELVQNEWQRQKVTSDLDRFMEMINQTRKTNLAYDLDRHTVGICAVGIAFKDCSNHIFSISVPVPSARFVKVKKLIEQTLLKTLKKIKQLT